MAFFITTPCPKQLSDMQETSDGWYCGSCRETVVDLTDATAADVMQHLNKGGVCGRARTNTAGRMLLVGAVAARLGGVAQADSTVVIPPIPEEDTTEQCDGSGETTHGEDTPTDTTEPQSAGDDAQGASDGRPPEEVNITGPVSGTFGYVSYVPAQPWGPQQSPEAARADRLAKRAQRMARRAEQARATANDLASDDATTGG